jgi:hypothetical protein
LLSLEASPESGNCDAPTLGGGALLLIGADTSNKNRNSKRNASGEGDWAGCLREQLSPLFPVVYTYSHKRGSNFDANELKACAERAFARLR